MTLTHTLAKHAAFALAGVCLTVLVTAIAASEPRGIKLEWRALVPENWESPLILPAPESDGHYPVDSHSLVHELDGQRINLPGYMIPVRYEQNVVSEFLFVPFLGHHMLSHAHYQANQMVYVELLEPVTVSDPFSAWLVRGVLRVASVTTEDGRTGYTLEQAHAEPYQVDEYNKNTQQHSNH